MSMRKELRPAPAGPVLILGEALVDEFAEGPVAGGAPFNVARSLAALGGTPRLASRLNPEDAAGRCVLQSLRRFGLDERGLQLDLAHATGRVSVLEDGPGQHRFVIHANAAWDFLDAAPLRALAEAEPPALVYFGSLAQRQSGSRAAIQSLLDLAGERGWRRYLDLNLRPGSDQPELARACLARAEWLKVNEDELLQLLRWFAPQALAGLAVDGPAEALAAAVGALMQGFAGLQRLVLTRGPLGYAAFAAPAQAQASAELLASGTARTLDRLVDTVGAGDAFSAMLLAALLHGLDWPQALSLANGMAAAMCGERGPVPAELDRFYAPWRAALEPAA